MGGCELESGEERRGFLSLRIALLFEERPRRAEATITESGALPLLRKDVDFSRDEGARWLDIQRIQEFKE